MKYGQDFEETFSPVAKITMVRLLVAIAAARHGPCSRPVRARRKRTTEYHEYTDKRGTESRKK